MPSLWTSIFHSFPLSKSQLTRTITWIARSRDRPLDIYMDFRDPDWDWDEASHIFGCKAMDSIMRILVPHAPRWRSIELLTDTWAPIFTFLSCTIAIDSAPHLQTVRLTRCNEYFVARGEAFRPESLASPVAWFQGGTSLSHLRHVSLSGVHVDWTQSGLAGLRELELRYHPRDVMPTLAEFRNILRENAMLERLVILGWGPRTKLTIEHDPGQDDPQMIDLPRLEALEIGFVDVEYSIHLLSLFALPNLQSLTIEDVAFGIQSCEPQDCSSLLDHLVELSALGKVPLPLLRVLSLHSIYANGSSIQGLFAQLGTVKSLNLDRVDAKTFAGVCSALHTCDSLEGLTLKNLDPMEAAFALASYTLPPHLRVFLDIDDVDVEQEDVQAAGMTLGSEDHS